MPKKGFTSVTLKTTTVKKVRDYVEDCDKKGIKTTVPKVVTKAIHNFMEAEGN